MMHFFALKYYIKHRELPSTKTFCFNSRRFDLSVLIVSTVCFRADYLPKIDMKSAIRKTVGFSLQNPV